MSDHQILIDKKGPLPISTTIKTGSVGPTKLFITGSVWTKKKDTQIGIVVSLDGAKVGQAAIWSNGSYEHRAVVPVFIEIDLNKPWPTKDDMPSYTFEISALNDDTESDYNDWFQLSLIM